MIYFVRAGDDGPIKIGMSRYDRRLPRNVGEWDWISQGIKSRITMLQTSHYLDLQLLLALWGSRCAERDLHIHFAPYHIRGEWFEAGERLLSFIKECRSNHLCRICKKTLIGDPISFVCMACRKANSGPKIQEIEQTKPYQITTIGEIVERVRGYS